MEKSRVMLFTSPTCPHCPSAKRIMGEVAKEREDIVYEDITTADATGTKLAEKYGIQSVPTFIISGPGHPELIGLRGLQGKDVLHKYIDISLGKRKVEEKKGFFQGLFS